MPGCDPVMQKVGLAPRFINISELVTLQWAAQAKSHFLLWGKKLNKRPRA